MDAPVVEELETDLKILRWYPYRWRVQDFIKIFKSDCQCEHYRLAAEGMKTLLGFLSICTVELLQVTYLHRNQSDAPAVEILSPVQIQVLKARFPKSPPVLTVVWEIESIAFLDSYLEHRRNLPLAFKFSGVVGLIYVNFAKVRFLLKFILNRKSKNCTSCQFIFY